MVLIFSLCAFFASGAVTVSLVSPANNSMSTSSRLTYTVNLTNGNETTYLCTLYTTENGSAGPASSYISDESITVTNNTEKSFTDNINVNDTTGYAYNATVRCQYNGAGPKTNSTINYYGVDTVDPVVVLSGETPLNGEWKADNATLFNLTVTERNADVCVLLTTLNFSGSTGAYRTYGQEAKISYTSGTMFNFTPVREFKDNNTDGLIWRYICNDTAGRTYSNTNQTFWIDTVAPTAFTFETANWLTSPGGHLILNNSYATDYTPEIEWGVVTELNFSRYRIRFYNSSGMTTYYAEKNITTRTTNKTNMSTLQADKTHYVEIVAKDLAGNNRTMTVNGYVYKTSSICHSLGSGWNICGILGNNKSLSQLLNETGGTTVAYLNSSNKFQTHTSGGSNGAVVVPSGRAFFTYLSAAGTWQDSVRNESAYSYISTIYNASNTNWNIVVNLNSTSSTNFTDIDGEINGDSTSIWDTNVTYFSLYNNSASSGSKYIPYVSNLTSLNGGTTVNYGDTIWMYLGITDVTSIDLNWSNI